MQKPACWDWNDHRSRVNSQGASPSYTPLIHSSSAAHLPCPVPTGAGRVSTGQALTSSLSRMSVPLLETSPATWSSAKLHLAVAQNLQFGLIKADFRVFPVPSQGKALSSQRPGCAGGAARAGFGERSQEGSGGAGALQQPWAGGHAGTAPARGEAGRDRPTNPNLSRAGPG